MSRTHESKPDSDTNADHHHGGAPQFLPHWIRDRWSALTVTVAGVALITRDYEDNLFGHYERDVYWSYDTERLAPA